MMLAVLETAESLVLDDEEANLAGDWHGNRIWTARAITTAATRTGARTLFHLGDLDIWPKETAELLRRIDGWAHAAREHPTRQRVHRILVTPGNHEDFDNIDAALSRAPGQAVRVSEIVWTLPRGFRFTVNHRTFMSFGGAGSTDFTYRRRGCEWWPAAKPTEAEVGRAVNAGPLEVLLSHDTSAWQVNRVARIIGAPSRWSDIERGYASVSRKRIADIVNGTQPLLHAHGQYRVRDSATFERPGLPSFRIEALTLDGGRGNMVLLDLPSLAVSKNAVPQ